MSPLTCPHRREHPTGEEEKPPLGKVMEPWELNSIIRLVCRTSIHEIHHLTHDYHHLHYYICFNEIQMKHILVIMNICVFSLGFNPVWEETLSFTLHMAEVVLVRFLVWDHDPIGRDFIGQRTVAFSSLMPGLCRIPQCFKG